MSWNNKSDSRPVNTVKRSDLAKALQQNSDLSPAESTTVVNQIFHHISEALIGGENVKLAGFGTFKLNQKKARLGRNPKTGKESLIAPRTVVSFKPSAMMKERVDSALGLELNSEKDCRKSTVPVSKVENKLMSDSASFSMRREEWIALFELLGSFVFIDTPSYETKSDEFVVSLLELKSIIDPSAAVTRKSILSWMKHNEKRWWKSIDKETLRPRFKRNLSTLRNISYKTDIVFAMVNIALAENQYGELEKSLILQAILDWDMSAKVMTDLEYVCPEVVLPREL